MSRSQEIIDYVGGGVAESPEDICRKLFEIELDALSKEELSEIDENVFTCDQCGWTLPQDDMGEAEESDGFLCRECEDENKDEEDD